jgi:hypothetical protein
LPANQLPEPGQAPSASGWPHASTDDGFRYNALTPAAAPSSHERLRRGLQIFDENASKYLVCYQQPANQLPGCCTASGAGECPGVTIRTRSGYATPDAPKRRTRTSTCRPSAIVNAVPEGVSDARRARPFMLPGK